MNRLADETTMAEEVVRHNDSFRHTIHFVDGNGNAHEVQLQVKVKRVELHPPIGKQMDYPSLKVAIVSAIEEQKPADRERIRWTLVTNLPVKSKQDALTVLNWYKQRWKIEVYFKILKSGFKAEDLKLRTAERSSRLISIFCILAWRIQWMTMLHRENPDLPPQLAFDATEIKIITLYSKASGPPRHLGDYILQVAKMGGYLARKSDPPPGNMVIWRGLNKLCELRAGYELASDVGN